MSRLAKVSSVMGAPRCAAITNMLRSCARAIPTPGRCDRGGPDEPRRRRRTGMTRALVLARAEREEALDGRAVLEIDGVPEDGSLVVVDGLAPDVRPRELAEVFHHRLERLR